MQISGIFGWPLWPRAPRNGARPIATISLDRPILILAPVLAKRTTRRLAAFSPAAMAQGIPSAPLPLSQFMQDFDRAKRPAIRVRQSLSCRRASLVPATGRTRLALPATYLQMEVADLPELVVYRRSI
jgi:hypothetical protein